MNNLLIALIFAALSILAFALFKYYFAKFFLDKHVYEKQNGLLTPAEFAFMQVLLESIKENYCVMCKVRLADLLKIRSGLSSKDWQKAYNKIVGKHVDFTICTADKLEIKAVIELDDRSHEKADRIERDNFVDTAMADAGLPIIHIAVQKEYKTAEIRKLLAEKAGL